MAALAREADRTIPDATAAALPRQSATAHPAHADGIVHRRKSPDADASASATATATNADPPTRALPAPPPSAGPSHTESGQRFKTSPPPPLQMPSDPDSCQQAPTSQSRSSAILDDSRLSSYGAIDSHRLEIPLAQPDLAADLKHAPPTPIGEPLKNENYFIVFPESLDLSLQDFDDRLIRLSQWRTDGGVYLFSWFFTSLTSIEAALPLPLILLLSGYDVAGTILATILTSLGFLSQLPKRFLWRTRPWMNGRAKVVRKDRTSSFPSRGVICGIVFPISLLYAYHEETGRPVHPLFYVLSTSFCVLCTSFARVNVGAHYPSDTIAGVFVGGLVQLLGFWSLQIWSILGAPIQPSAMYASDSSSYIHTSLRQTPFLLLFVAVFCSYAITWISMKGFWQKCNYVFGMLFSCLTFRFVYLNPSMTSSDVSLPPISGVSWLQTWLWGLLILAYGMKTRGKKGLWRVANFVLIYHLSFALLVWYRM